MDASRPVAEDLQAAIRRLIRAATIDQVLVVVQRRDLELLLCVRADGHE